MSIPFCPLPFSLVTVEGPVVSCACPDEVVLEDEVDLVRALQEEVANGFRNATPVAVSGNMAAPEFQLLVEAAVSESVDGGYFPPLECVRISVSG